MKIEFRTEQKKTTLMDSKSSERRTIPSEVRHDPLTGRTARICHFMPLQWGKPDFEKLTAGTESWCPFCPGKVLEVTPRFPPEILPEGRLTLDDMVLFPNIAPYDELAAVATLGSRHFTPMTEFTPKHIARAFGFVQDFFKKVHAPNLMKMELDSAKKYRQANDANFWDDYVALEKKEGERFLGRTGNTSWFLAYAPMGVAGDVVGVVEGKRSTLELTDADFLDMGEGLCRAMRAYDEMGIWSFNANLFTGPGTCEDYAGVHIVFSPRTFFNQALGTTDIGALRNLYNETICMAFPEEIRDKLAPFFDS